MREYYERRGTMVYTEETEPGKARFIQECATVEEADERVRELNDEKSEWANLDTLMEPSHDHTPNYEDDPNICKTCEDLREKLPHRR